MTRSFDSMIVTEDVRPLLEYVGEGEGDYVKNAINMRFFKLKCV